MKKFLALILATILLVSMFGFAGADEVKTYKVGFINIDEGL